jgi:hypothetical protein
MRTKHQPSSVSTKHPSNLSHQSVLKIGPSQDSKRGTDWPRVLQNRSRKLLSPTVTEDTSRRGTRYRRRCLNAHNFVCEGGAVQTPLWGRWAPGPTEGNTFHQVRLRATNSETSAVRFAADPESTAYLVGGSLKTRIANCVANASFRSSVGCELMSAGAARH